MTSDPNKNIVVVRQGAAAIRADWTFGLCSCCDDMSACCLTTWCTWLSAGAIWDKGLGQSFLGGYASSLCVSLSLIMLVVYSMELHLLIDNRCILFAILLYLPTTVLGKLGLMEVAWIPFLALVYPFLWTAPLREKAGIQKGNPIVDIILMWFCGCCQVIRELREAKLIEVSLTFSRLHHSLISLLYCLCFAFLISGPASNGNPGQYGDPDRDGLRLRKGGTEHAYDNLKCILQLKLKSGGRLVGVCFTVLLRSFL